jgi:hydroxypyruvate isomerase
VTDPAPGVRTPSYTVNISILLTDLPLLQRPAAVAAAGFGAVELWWPFEAVVPADREVDALVAAVSDAGVRLTGLNFAGGDMAAGERGLLSSPSRSAEFRDNVDVVAGIGERLGCRVFNALYGNREDGVDPRAQDDLAAENLALAARAVGRAGGTVVVEPLSGVDRYPLRTAADAVAVLDRVEAANTGLLADLYHLAANGDDVDAAITTYADCVRHVQVADVPGRGQPGTGGAPLPRWLAALARAGYDGWVGLEYKATGPDPFAWLPRERRRPA